jgi:Mlc titration factor MtfA (ptsG expression regulator)
LVLLLMSLVAVLAMAWFWGQPLLGEWRRRRIRRQPFPAEWRQVLRRRVPYFHTLPADLQLQLKKRIQVFLAEKPFIGCAGLEVTEEMRVTIAAQACLLVLHQPGECFANLRQILVYPGPFAVDKLHADGSGVVEDRRQVLAGESWTLGQVVLSWEDALAGAPRRTTAAMS